MQASECSSGTQPLVLRVNFLLEDASLGALCECPGEPRKMRCLIEHGFWNPEARTGRTRKRSKGAISWYSSCPPPGNWTLFCLTNVREHTGNTPWVLPCIVHRDVKCRMSLASFFPFSRGHFPILSRGPSFQKTMRTPGETAIGFGKEGWLKRLEEESTPMFFVCLVHVCLGGGVGNDQ